MPGIVLSALWEYSLGNMVSWSFPEWLGREALARVASAGAGGFARIVLGVVGVWSLGFSCT